MIELLTVIAIIGILAALIAPVFKQFSKSHVTVAATRQLLDDCARARQLAITERATVYLVFVPTNFWSTYTGANNFPVNNGLPGGPWSALTSVGKYNYQTLTVVTQMYAAQMNGYFMESLRSIGDQPGQNNPQDLVRVKTLPSGSFIAPVKFTAPSYPNTVVPYPYTRTDLPIYGFRTTNTLLFPTVNVLTNSSYVNSFNANGGMILPYIAFNYLGQLTPGDGSVLPYDENIPLAYGNFSAAINPATKSPIQRIPNATELPPGNNTNIGFNVIHIDHLTGRARLERQEVQ